MKIFLGFFLFVEIFASCEQLAKESDITTDKLEQQLLDINDFIASTSCKNDSNCRFMAYGSKACGGPQGYLIYSASIDEDALKKMVTQYTAAEDSYNKTNGIVSDCSLPNPPVIMECSDGKCIQIE